MLHGAIHDRSCLQRAARRTTFAVSCTLASDLLGLECQTTDHRLCRWYGRRRLRRASAGRYAQGAEVVHARLAGLCDSATCRLADPIGRLAAGRAQEVGGQASFGVRDSLARTYGYQPPFLAVGAAFPSTCFRQHFRPTLQLWGCVRLTRLFGEVVDPNWVRPDE